MARLSESWSRVGEGMTSFFRYRTRDGVKTIQLQCPQCETWGEIDEEQFHGRVSVVCVTPGCKYHETHDFSREGTLVK